VSPLPVVRKEEKAIDKESNQTTSTAVKKEPVAANKPKQVEKHQAFKTRATEEGPESDPGFKAKESAKKSIAEAVQSLKKQFSKVNKEDKAQDISKPPLTESNPINSQAKSRAKEEIYKEKERLLRSKS
jgi:hypothetical protein